MYASALVDCRVFMQDRALRKYFVDSGLTDVVKPGGRQYTLKHGKVMVEVMAAGIEALEFRSENGKEIRFNLLMHDHDALFNIIDQQRRDQAVMEATMLHAGKRQRGMTLNRWLLRRPSCTAGLLTKTTKPECQGRWR